MKKIISPKLAISVENIFFYISKDTRKKGNEKVNLPT